MKLVLSFAEISDYVRLRYGKTLTITRISDTELRVLYTQKVLVASIQIPVNIVIDEVRPAELLVTYKGRFGIDMIISGALTFFKSQLPEMAAAITPRDGHQLLIDLAQLPKAKALVDNVSLQSLTVLDDALELQATLKSKEFKD